MSDENQGAPAPAPTSSVEQTIPKARLDEVLAQNRAKDEQLKFQQQMLSQMSQRQQPQVPSADQERLRRLKEDNPEAYRAEVQILKLRQENASTKQAVAGLWDQQDRMNLLSKYKGADKRITEVESTLEQFRANGHFNKTREEVYFFLLGQDKLKEEMAKAQAPGAIPTATPTQEDDVPTSDPRFASTLAGGKAPSSGSNKGFAEVEKELENVEF